MNLKSRYLLTAVIAFSLVMPGLASADRYKHGYKHNYGQNKHYRQGNRYQGYGGSGKNINHYYKHDNSNEKLLIGLVVGGIVGYAINSAQHRKVYSYPDRYPTQQPSVYPASSPQYSSSTCLQEREYQTTVVVGGRNVPAYGTACLQPDGSWRQGPAMLASY